MTMYLIGLFTIPALIVAVPVGFLLYWLAGEFFEGGIKPWLQRHGWLK